MIDAMWATDNVRQWRKTVGSPPGSAGPAMTTLRSVVAPLASTIRAAGIVYIVVQVLIWHSFYTGDPRRLTAPLIAIAWAAGVIVCLRRRWPSPVLACVDSAVYLTLAVSAQECVPPTIRDDAFSWLVIGISGQLIIPGWYAPGPLAALLTLLAPAAFWLGDVLPPVTDARTLAGATMVLIVIGLVHIFGRRELYRRAEAADATLDAAAQAATQQYAVLARTIERREHERLVHDTVLNTLTALARVGPEDPAAVVSRCRQDVALVEDALGDRDETAARPGRTAGGLAQAVRAVVGDLRARGLTVHVEVDGDEAPVLPARVTTAIANATREALSNVAAHAGTGEAWVEVRQMTAGARGIAVEAPAEGAGQVADARRAADAGQVAGAGVAASEVEARGRVEVIVRDRGAGFDPDRADPTRLGLRRSIAERAADCGGQARIWSAPGEGTVVRLSWPAPLPSGEPERPADQPDGLRVSGGASRQERPW
jgi:signal transduction histidine kinase